MLALNALSANAFASYGSVIEPSAGEIDAFEVLLREPEVQGWRLARSRLRREPIESLGRHENTREAFVPLEGTTMIVVAERHAPENLRAFVLDRPICLYKDIWHATTALTETASLLIAENDDVDQAVHTLSAPLELILAAMEKPA